MDIKTYKRVACETIGLPATDKLEGRKGLRPFARHMIFSRLYEDGHSDEAIAVAFRCDRSTVHHGLKVIRDAVTLHQQPYVGWIEAYNSQFNRPESAVKAVITTRGILFAGNRGSAILYPTEVVVINRDGRQVLPTSTSVMELAEMITQRKA